jgi:hypothetical protein
MLKLDIARAFDSVSWSLLFEVLRKLGFGPRFCEWVAILLSKESTRASPHLAPVGSETRGSLVTDVIHVGNQHAYQVAGKGYRARYL